MHRVILVAAIDDSRGLARNGKLPWDLPSDRKYFREQVEEGPVLMGWNTFASNKFKPYGHGHNYVLTRGNNSAPGVTVLKDAEKFFASLKGDMWVAGGGQIFAFALPYATHLYLTRVKGEYDCDVFFPEFESKFELTHQEPEKTENGITYKIQLWEPKRLG